MQLANFVRSLPTGSAEVKVKSRSSNYDSENSWISDGLPSSSRRRRRSDGRGEGVEWREKRGASKVDVDVDGAKIVPQRSPVEDMCTMKFINSQKKIEFNFVFLRLKTEGRRLPNRKGVLKSNICQL